MRESNESTNSEKARICHLKWNSNTYSLGSELLFQNDEAHTFQCVVKAIFGLWFI